jgi:hypothetical protein
MYNSRYLYLTSPYKLIPPAGKQIQADCCHTVIAHTIIALTWYSTSTTVSTYRKIIVLKNRRRLQERLQTTSTKWKSREPQSSLPHWSYATLWNTAAKNNSWQRSSHIFKTPVYSRFSIRSTILLLQSKPTSQTLNTPTYIHPTVFFLVIRNIYTS